MSSPPGASARRCTGSTTRSGSAFDSFDDLRREMIAEAAGLGGDAVILGPKVSEEDFILTGEAMIRSEERQLQCLVIAFRNEAATASTG